MLRLTTCTDWRLEEKVGAALAFSINSYSVFPSLGSVRCIFSIESNLTNTKVSFCLLTDLSIITKIVPLPSPYTSQWVSLLSRFPFLTQIQIRNRLFPNRHKSMESPSSVSIYFMLMPRTPSYFPQSFQVRAERCGDVYFSTLSKNQWLPSASPSSLPSFPYFRYIVLVNIFNKSGPRNCRDVIKGA